MINIQVENKKFLYQVILFVILSNLIVYTLSTDKNIPEKSIVPSDYLEIITTLNLLTPFKKYKKVNLFNKAHNILIKDVYLVREVNTHGFNNEKMNQFTIGVSPQNIHYFLSPKSSIFDVYPSEANISYKSKRKKRSYEIYY